MSKSRPHTGLPKLGTDQKRLPVGSFLGHTRWGLAQNLHIIIPKVYYLNVYLQPEAMAWFSAYTAHSELLPQSQKIRLQVSYWMYYFNFFSMRHCVPSSFETYLCDFGYWDMGRLSDFVSDFHYPGRSFITFITVVGAGIRPWCWAFRGVLFFPNNWVVIYCILIWKIHIWFSILSSQIKECSGVWALSFWKYTSQYFCQLMAIGGMENVWHTRLKQGLKWWGILQAHCSHLNCFSQWLFLILLLQVEFNCF